MSNQSERNLDKEFLLLARDRAQSILASGNLNGLDESVLRELEKLCWHEDGYSRGMCVDGDKWPCMCGVIGVDSAALLMHIKQSNPTYTIQSIRAVLESLGEWERFKCWHWRQCVVQLSNWMGDREGKMLTYYAHDAMFDILTSDPLMLKAAIEFLKGLSDAV